MSVAEFFTLAMVALIVSLGMFLREVFLAVSWGSHTRERDAAAIGWRKLLTSENGH